MGATLQFRRKKMITAKIQTQTRTIKVTCNNEKDHAISSLQNAVSTLKKEDGRCKFIVMEGGHEIYSWEYQPTIREEKKAAKAKKDPKYDYGFSIFVILKDESLDYDNIYNGEWFNSVREAREYMKEHGFSVSGYSIVYEYSVWNVENEYTYGFGIGFTREEAKENHNENLKYYDLALTKYGYIKEL